MHKRKEGINVKILLNSFVRPRRTKWFVFKKRKLSLLAFRECRVLFSGRIMIKRKQSNRVEPEANNAYKTDLHTINDLIESML